MYLKRIEMENFKSFGRKTVIEFTNGFNGICGPNGSGKSNITDAILFVIGPKSSKMLRAQRLTDLIYDGGKTRNPASYCKVSLVFDNSDRAIPIDEDEVVFTRVIRRSDTSEEGFNSYFYINGERARLQDFTSLLSHAHIDSEGYNFVQQGDVTNIVKMTPFERRKILEDISGISQYDAEIAKSEEKKKKVEENIEKIKAVLEEIKRNIENLEKERNVALQYLELQRKKREAEKTLHIIRRDAKRREVEKYEKILKSNEEEIEICKKKIEEIKREEEKVAEELKNIGVDENILNEVRTLEKEINDLRIKLSRITMDLENKEERKKEDEEKLKKVREELKNKRKERKGLSDKIKDKRKILNEKSKEKEKIEKQLHEEERKVDSSSEEIKNLKTARKEKEEILARLNEDLNNLRVEKEKLQSRLDNMEESKAKLEDSLSLEEKNLRDIEWNINEIKKNFRKSESFRKNYEERILLLRDKDKKLRAELDEIEKEYRKTLSVYESLKARTESSEYSQAVMAIIEARDKGILKGIHGTIEELGDVDEKFALAIEIAAGPRYYSIVVEDDAAAAKAIEYLKKNNLGRAIFLPLNKMARGMPRGKAVLASRNPKSYGFAINLIKFNKKYESAFWYVFGDTVVVEDLDTARKLMGGVRLVTLDGQLIEASGAMIGGSVSRKSLPKGDLRKLREKLRKLTERKEKITEELKNIQEELTKIGIEMSEKSRDFGSVEEKLRNLTAAREECRKRIAKIKNEISKIDAEMGKLKKDIESLEDKENEIKNRIDSVRKEIEEIDVRIEEVTPQKIYEKIKNLRDRLSVIVSEENNIDKEIHVLTEKIKAINTEIERLKREEASLTANIKKLDEDIKKLLKERESKDIKLRQLQEVHASLSRKIEEEEGRRDELLRKIESLRNERENYSERIRNLEFTNITTNARINHLNNEIKDIENKLRNYEDVSPLEIKDEKELKRIIADSESKMKSLEPVNFKSIEEYDIEVERFRAMQEDYNKLVEERKELIKLVEDLNEKKKVALLRVFEEVNKNFKEIYSELTDGMEGELVLENPKDPFKGGLTIRVRQGKKYVRIERLSGGEKSLTALALIFALQRYNPSPIYILDEVDMFLDPVNAESVAKMVKKSSALAQFIMISLRKVTLKYADTLIGVAKGVDGVSRVFSARLEDLEFEESEGGEEVSEYAG